MNTLILALVLASGPTLGLGPSLSESSGSNPITDRVAGYKLGAADWYGAPTPTLDCKADSVNGDLICNGIRSQKVATSNGNSWASSVVITLNTTCALQYPAGPPAVVTLTDTVGQGSATRCVTSCIDNGVGGAGIVTVTQAVPSSFTGTLTLTPAASGQVACDGTGVGALLKVNSGTTIGSPFYPDNYTEAAHVGVGPTSPTAHYVSPASIVNTSAPFLACFIADAPAAVDGNYDVAKVGDFAMGFYAWSGGTAQRAYWAPGGGGNVYSTSGATSPTVALCYGFDGTNCYTQIGATGALGSRACTTTGNTTRVYVGTDASTSGYPVKIYEALVTTTAPTAATIQTKLNAMLSCRSAGPCIPEDANTVTHVTFDASANPVDSKGLAWTKQGSPTATSSVYQWPGLRTPLAQPATALSSAYFTTTGFGDITSATTECQVIKTPPSFTASWRYLSRTSGNGYYFGWYSNDLQIRAYANSSLQEHHFLAGGTRDAGAFTVVCWSMVVSGGNTTVRSAANGASSSPSSWTGTVGQPNGTFYLGGGNDEAIVKYARWTNWAGSDSELQQLTRSQIGLLSQKGAALPFSRADVGFVCPVLDSACFWVGAGIPEIDRRGIWVGGASENAIGSSEAIAAAWNAAGTITMQSDSASCPLLPGPSSIAGRTRMTLINFPQDGSMAYPTGATATNGQMFTDSLWMSTVNGDPACTIRFRDLWQAASAIDQLLTATPVRYSVTGVTASNASAPRVEALNGSQCARICAWGGQTNLLAPLKPYRPTTGSAYTGPATTHQGVPPRVDAEVWTNLALQSEDLATTWITDNSTVATNTFAAPDLSFSMDKVTSTTNTGSIVQAVLRTSSTGPFISSIYARSSTTGSEVETIGGTCGTTGTNAVTSCTCGTEDGRACTAVITGTGNYNCVGYASFTDVPTRLWVTYSCTSATTIGYSIVHGGQYGTSTGAGGFWGAQVEAGATLHPYCPTGASASTCGTSGGVGKTVVNLITNNETLNLWIKLSGSSVSDNNANCPVDPANSSRRMSLIFSGNPGGIDGITTGSGASHAHSAYLATKLGGAACRAAVGDANTGSLSSTLLTETPVRLAQFGGAGGSGIWITTNNMASPCSQWCVSGAQDELSTFAGRYCGPTTSASKTCVFPYRAAQPECVSVTASTASGSYSRVLGFGPEANSLLMLTSPNVGGWFDGVTDCGAVTGTPISTEQTYVTCVGTESATIYFSNGTSKTCPLTNFSGFANPAPSLYLGNGANGLNPLNGWIKSWASCRKAGGCR